MQHTLLFHIAYEVVYAYMAIQHEYVGRTWWQKRDNRWHIPTSLFKKNGHTNQAQSCVLCKCYPNDFEMPATIMSMAREWQRPSENWRKMVLSGAMHEQNRMFRTCILKRVCVCALELKSVNVNVSRSLYRENGAQAIPGLTILKSNEPHTFYTYLPTESTDAIFIGFPFVFFCPFNVRWF